ncbi:MAG: DNA-processing protein DprA [Neisseria sp.]|nr:DNA-processing protein DprA [Neisseria sp.]
MEAALRSGSLVTARCARELGREVFALPGPIGNPGSEGPHCGIE